MKNILKEVQFQSIIGKKSEKSMLNIRKIVKDLKKKDMNGITKKNL